LGSPPALDRVFLRYSRRPVGLSVLWHLHLNLTFRWPDLGLNVLLIFIPLSVSVLERRSCSIVPLITLLVAIPLPQAQQYPDFCLLVHIHDACPSKATSNPSVVSFLAIVPLAKVCIGSRPLRLGSCSKRRSFLPSQQTTCHCASGRRWLVSSMPLW